MDTGLTPRELELFNFLRNFAVEGKRCPTNDELKYNNFPSGLKSLAEKGYIIIYIYSLNWRVVEIRKGSSKGKRTEECPRSMEPYKVINTHGTFINGKEYTHKVRSSYQVIADANRKKEEFSQQDEDDAALMEKLL